MKIRSDVPKITRPAEANPTARAAEARPEEKKSGWQARSSVRAAAPVASAAPLEKARAMHAAFDTGDARKVLSLFAGATAESNAALTTAYRAEYGRDLEYDMRGFPLTMKGLEGASLKQGFAALHGPRVEKNAARIAELTKANPASTPEGRKELYRMLSTAGGEERTLLDAAYKRQTGKNLASALKPVTEANAAEQKPITSDPKKTIAIIVSAGNWKDVLSGETDKHVGGYHWREIEAYVTEAINKGFTPVIYTPDGLPPSPDALSLLQGKLGPKVGFGLPEGTGPDSRQGKLIMAGFAETRSLKDFDPSKFATLHIAGGHGAHHDLVGNAAVESAATKLHEQGKIITAVCHATPALGKLVKGGPATGYSPELDKLNKKNGLMLPEFDPPYDAHQGLRDLGAKFTKIDSVQAFININHTETFDRNGVPIVTGTGPEATDNVARIALKWLEENAR